MNMSASSKPEERIREGYEQNFFLSIGAAAVRYRNIRFSRRGAYMRK
jgi:hypothetical protein